jgi:hypothetical protein
MTRRYAWSSRVVGTGVDPVTFRFSGRPDQADLYVRRRRLTAQGEVGVAEFDQRMGGVWAYLQPDGGDGP